MPFQFQNNRLSSGKGYKWEFPMIEMLTVTSILHLDKMEQHMLGSEL